MPTLTRAPHTQHQTGSRDELLVRLIEAVERLEQRFDEFAGSYLDARFPYGKPTDRWPRRG